MKTAVALALTAIVLLFSASSREEPWEIAWREIVAATEPLKPGEPEQVTKLREELERNLDELTKPLDLEIRPEDLPLPARKEQVLLPVEQET